MVPFLVVLSGLAPCLNPNEILWWPISDKLCLKSFRSHHPLAVPAVGANHIDLHAVAEGPPLAARRLLMHLGQIAAEQPGKAAVMMAGSGQTITFAELDAAANRLAHVLHEAGLRPGDNIAFMLENRWE